MLKNATSLSLPRLGGFAHGGALAAQRGPAAQRADRGRAADAQQRAAQPDGHRGRPGGLEPQGAGPRAGGRLRQVTTQTSGTKGAQGSHTSWKTWKEIEQFSSHGE